MVRPLQLLRQGLAQIPIVLDHADNEINGLRGGVTTVDGGRKHARIVLLAGAGECASLDELSTGAKRCTRSHSDHGKGLHLICWTILTILKVDARGMVTSRPGSHLDTVRCSCSRTGRNGHRRLLGNSFGGQLYIC